MSYGFSVRAADKDAARAAVAAELDKVVAAQEIHTHDRDQAEVAAGAFIDIAPEPGDDQEIVVSVSGSVQWRGFYPTDHIIVGASVNVSASIAAKPTAG